MIEETGSMRSAEERYRLLIDSITDYAIYMLDVDGIVSSWNPGAERFKLYTESEIIGKHFSEFYLPEDRANDRPAIALRTAAEEGRFEGEGWRVKKDGTRFWAHVIIDPIRTTSGKLIGFAKITRDLSERKATQELLRKSEQQFRLLVQGVTDYAIYMMDVEGHVSSWNGGAERIKMYSAEEIIGEHFSRFFQSEDRESGFPQRALDTAAKDGRFESEGWRIRKDGSKFWANAVIDAIRDESGTLIGFAKITRDISQKRETERQLETAREELFQAQKMEAVGQLTGGVAHDFNNLLMAIQGSLELLRKTLPYSSRTAPLLANALQATQRGASLTQRMLAFSRKQELTVHAVDIPSIVTGMTDLLQRTLGPSVILENKIPSHLPLVHTDANQLESALLNLALNAKDAMLRGGFLTIGADVHVKGRENDAELQGCQYVCLWIRDEGEGMEEETLTKATTPFFTTKGVGKGTGLGLPMVHGLMAQSGGKLVLKSVKDVGTTAELWLPIADAATQTVEDQKPATSSSADDRVVILAVDDDPLVLMNTVLMLQDLGHYVVEANSGIEAMRILAESEVQLVVTDHAMPKMTGSELAAQIRVKWPKTQLILATGYADLPPGADAQLPRLAKPFTEQQLAEAVSKAIKSI
ncbi:PAS domain-containing sensor histidine kinase [Rhizobium sp. TH2]|uniref:hybrid sensor histidine kinase/response regulator n=1 Tax=Rhizobium sp. TH2 TaxID=2775403 RepID=UPI0021581D89|nr:PAS domain-containing sensor histidine kinase [Rhizobium sp. TH2]